MGEDLPCCSNKVQPVSFRKRRCEHQPTDKAYFSDSGGKPFLRVLPTKWRWKPYGIDTKRNYVTVTLSIQHLRRLTCCGTNIKVQSSGQNTRISEISEFPLNKMYQRSSSIRFTISLQPRLVTDRQTHRQTRSIANATLQSRALQNRWQASRCDSISCLLLAYTAELSLYSMDGWIMRLCARIILRIIGDLAHNWASPA